MGPAPSPAAKKFHGRKNQCGENQIPMAPKKSGPKKTEGRKINGSYQGIA
jgi:hypothetical protein